MPSYKLTYFNVRGRGECIRLIFAAAGVKYEDVRIEGVEQWKQVKDNFKFGMVPEIDIDGKVFAQSRAIMLYLAKEFGYYPASHMEQLGVDEILFLLDDLITADGKVVFAKPEEKEKLAKDFREITVEKTLINVEKIVKNNGDNGILVGSKMSVADIAVFDCMTSLGMRYEGLLNKYPGVQKVLDKVGAIEGVKKWIEQRPKTEF